MKIEEYQRQSQRTMPINFIKEDLIKNMCFGLGGETGEVLDIFKKYFYQGHNLDRNMVIDELGDIMFYMVNLCSLLDISMINVLENNIEKLNKRYPKGFEVERSINRWNKKLNFIT